MTCPDNIVDSGVLQVNTSGNYLVSCVRTFKGAHIKDKKVIKMRSMKIFDGSASLLTFPERELLMGRIVT